MKAKFFLLGVFTILSSTFLFSQNNIEAQNKIMIASGINHSMEFQDISNNTLSRNWKETGISFKIGADINVWKTLYISPCFMYSNYRLDKQFEGASIPEIIYIDIEGNDAKIYNSSIDIKAIFPAETIRNIYLLTGLSYIVESYGEVRHKTTYLGNEQSEFIVTTKKFENKYYFAHKVGLGITLFQYKNLTFGIEGSYISNYKDRLYTSGVVTIGYMF